MGVVAAAAIAATEVLPAQGKPVAETVALGATTIGTLADILEQVSRPDLGQVIGGGGGQAAMYAADQTTLGKMLMPAINELIEAWKATDTSKSIQEWINQQWKIINGK